MKSRRSGSLTNGGGARDEAGLTLLEVLFSIAVLGIGLAVIMQGLALGLRVRRESAAMQEMSLVAGNTLSRLLSQGEAPPDAEEGEAGDYRWRIEPDPSLAGEEREEGANVPLRLVIEAPSGRSLEVVTVFPAGDRK
jgi:type II secretory pathway pseudopilin PulG